MRLAGDEAGTQPAAADAVGRQSDLTADEVWHLVLAVRRRRDQQRGDDGCWGFRRDGGGWVLAAEQVADLLVDPKRRSIHWLRVQPDAPGLAIVDLHLAHALCDRGRGCVVAVLGQSLDGYIATCGGDSRYINGPESLVHLHRVRALSDAVLVGVGTALADAPRLTTRHVVGPSATRVVLDPKGRLPPTSGLLGDGLAPTIVVRATTERAASRRLTEQATLLSLPAVDGMIPPADVVAALAALGVGRLLVEGGGVTVGRFLDAGLINRLQLAVSPLILGSGRPALPVAPADRLDQGLRPRCRAHAMGADVLFDLSLTPWDASAAANGEIC